MKIKNLSIKGAALIIGDRHDDERGFFQELYSEGRNPENTRSRWLQVNMSSSKQHVIRGIHVAPYPKLITCVKGAIFDVIVDIERKKWVGIWLIDGSPTQLYIPSGCGHAFYSKDPDNRIVYLQGGLYSPTKERLYRWNDPELDIDWPKGDYIISERDRNAPLLSDKNHVKPQKDE